MPETTTKKYIMLADEDPVRSEEKPNEDTGTKLYRIRAVKDFSNVQAGELGGYIESYDSLSQEGDCWVGRNCKVYEGAKVEMNAVLDGNVELYGNSIATENAYISGMIRADQCNFKAHSRAQGNLMLRSVTTTGSALIEGDGCVDHARAEGGTVISVKGFYYKDNRK